MLFPFQCCVGTLKEVHFQWLKKPSGESKCNTVFKFTCIQYQKYIYMSLFNSLTSNYPIQHYIIFILYYTFGGGTLSWQLAQPQRWPWPWVFRRWPEATTPVNGLVVRNLDVNPLILRTFQIRNNIFPNLPKKDLLWFIDLYCGFGTFRQLNDFPSRFCFRGTVSKKAALELTVSPAVCASEAKSCARPCTRWAIFCKPSLRWYTAYLTQAVAVTGWVHFLGFGQNIGKNGWKIVLDQLFGNLRQHDHFWCFIWCHPKKG